MFGLIGALVQNLATGAKLDKVVEQDLLLSRLNMEEKLAQALMLPRLAMTSLVQLIAR